MLTSSVWNYLNPATYSPVFNLPWRVQHALAALCIRHKMSETIEPRMLRVILDTVTPK